jgi:hypothetical protein
MEKLETIKLSIKKYIFDNWNSDRLFDKGKIIAMGVVIFFILWKLIYSIFV